MNTVDVESVDEMTQRVTSHGGQIALSKMAIPGMGWVAYCTDPSGVLFGLFESDSSAA